jgi:type II secretory ATPase GspE/PulE/Tfp pilus assembly ATPase PilB-like protein
MEKTVQARLLSQMSPQDTLTGLASELVAAGLLGQDQARVLLQEQRRTGRSLEELVVSFGFLDTRVLHDFLETQNQIHLFCPKTHPLNKDLLKDFAHAHALTHQCLPLHLEESVLEVAMVDVHNVVARDALMQAFPNAVQIKTHFIPLEVFLERLEEAYERHIDLSYLLASLEKDTDQKASALSEGRSPAQNFVEALLLKAVREKASDIHLEPSEAFVRVRHRVDGVLRPAITFHKEHWSAICVCLKIMAGLNIAENRLPQGGRFTHMLSGRHVDFRVSTHPTQHGENIVLRLLDRLYGLKGLEQLGFAPFQVNLLKKSLSRPDGMILLTGPTGAGKTTTLYSMLAHLNGTQRNIMTLEEPIEYSLSGLRQSEVKDTNSMGFAGGVRSILRQDPDVIFIGEIRDEETATMAVRASMTGHLVLSTLHTNDTLCVVQRLKDLGLDPHLLEGNLLCLVAQRLVRRLCVSCKQKKGTTFEGTGCPSCAFTGYQGRLALAEVLPLTLSLERRLIMGDSKAQILKGLQEEGFETLWQCGMHHVKSGNTSMDELMRVVRPEDWDGQCHA